MRTTTQQVIRGDRSTLWGMLTTMLAMIVLLVLTAALVSAPVSAETPAQRCKRETSAYNTAWAAIGKKPPVPYKCGGNNEPPPRTLSPSTSTPEEEPDETVEPSDVPEAGTPESRPSINAPTERREIEHPDANQPTVKSHPEGRSSTNGSSATIRTEDGGMITLRLPDSVRAFWNGDQQVLRISRQSTASPSQVRIPADIPAGSRWIKAGDANRIALVGRGGNRLLSLSLHHGSNLRLSSSANDIVGVFTEGQLPLVADILASNRHPAGGNGCTTAPGGAGAHNCIDLEGDKERVTKATSSYYYATPGDNVCNRHHQFLYTTVGHGVVTRSVNPPGCVNGFAMAATGDYVTLPIDAPFLILEPGTKFCTQVMNSATDKEWSPWACMDIKA